MIKALKETINPKGGNGAMETFIFILLLVIVVGVMILSGLHTDIPPMIQTIATGLMGYVGYIVGKNNNDNKKEIEEQESDGD